ncbi:MAG: peptidase T [Candidatus Latescibacteria bacterium]|nr:peptidase T [Candidatus Latescibacterota bacterium]NIM21757.1 peptidase T [Candidatus Latescibacterota bacterium]NIM65895.1 peptidase T [Candidatus Latescibacterota bacterium]NIO02640.1 peptidase T [Candidatus Latescibacterota bacterium]NIO29621.1 peptidase T [Candidatus Latescibacterota bacterium]
MKFAPPKESALERFKRYVQVDTQSQEDSDRFPSTEKQLALCRMLLDELKALGVGDATMDQYGYVFGTVPSNLTKEETRRVPAIGFIAHVDTSPAVTGAGVKPVVHENYQGGDITLPGDPTKVIRVEEYPNLKKYTGMDIVTSDGTTLLGADDKAGIAEIMTAVDMLFQNPDLRHGTIKIGFTPDEEVGQGTKYFDIKKFGADFAYTLDGGPLGDIEFETFNAFTAIFEIEGIGVHPGYAKDKLVNAIKMVSKIIERLPQDMSPETTADRQGYIHPYVIDGQNEKVTLKILLRDFEMSGIEEKKKLLEKIREEVQEMYPKGKTKLEYKEYYRNMRYKIEEEPRLLEYAEEAIRRVGAEPRHTLIRGGTDGATLSYKGLLTPNLFAGGEAFHSKIEWVPVQVMEMAVGVILNLAQIWTEKSLEK